MKYVLCVNKLVTLLHKYIHVVIKYRYIEVQIQFSYNHDKGHGSKF